jgi:hypothetical protein
MISRIPAVRAALELVHRINDAPMFDGIAELYGVIEVGLVQKSPFLATAF